MKPATATAAPVNAKCPLFMRITRISSPPTNFLKLYTYVPAMGSAS